MRKLFIVSFLFSIFYFLFSMAASAQTICTPIYGGGQSCISGALLIDKKVLNPATNQFVDNLGVNDPKYQAQSPVFFRLVITNTGVANLRSVTVKDTFPQFVDFAAGAGNFDANSKTLTFTINNLAPNESRTFAVSGRIVSNDKLPLDKGIICVVNKSSANTPDLLSQDNAQLCIEKIVPTPTPAAVVPPVTKGGLKVFPPALQKKTPPTGPEAILGLLFATSGAAGIYLRKISGR